jgi:hypothetical protein
MMPNPKLRIGLQEATLANSPIPSLMVIFVKGFEKPHSNRHDF